MARSRPGRGPRRPLGVRRSSTATDNPLYHDILRAFERETGLPVLVNTSFNVHEEPIVNAPGECIKALRDGRIDFGGNGPGEFKV